MLRHTFDSTDDADGAGDARRLFDDPDALAREDEDDEDDEHDEHDEGASDDAPDDRDEDPDDVEALDADFPLGDGVADTQAEVWCPYCGEPNEIGLDPGGGPLQEYVEDCGVCCQPWRVFVSYQEDGSASVGLEPADGS
ncbi:MAG: CPXCG motif-containing cysteine-rich protein [Gemmatirosa sp.]